MKNRVEQIEYLVNKYPWIIVVIIFVMLWLVNVIAGGDVELL